MFQRILVPLDGSARAEQAFPIAERIARATGCSLTLLRIVETLKRFDEHLVPENSGELLESDIVRAKAYLQHTLAKSDLEGIGITTEVCTGKVARQILQCAAERQDDLIVMCSHGTTGLRRWLLGSVAQKVVHNSTVPVLIVREDHPLTLEQQEASGEPFQILVPLDGSRLAEAALLPAAQVCFALSASHTGILHLVRVVEPIVAMRDIAGAIATLNEEDMRLAANYLRDLTQRLSEGDFASFHLTIKSTAILGTDIASSILEMARDGTYVEGQGGTRASGMIAMSTHGRNGLAYWIMGSIAERVLSATTLPMLVVRPEKEHVQPDHQSATRHTADMA